MLTQNYKAEHEKASSAVITAVTKSGTNRWAGDGFMFFQNKNLVSLDKYSEERDLPKPTYERLPAGHLDRRPDRERQAVRLRRLRGEPAEP